MPKAEAHQLSRESNFNIVRGTGTMKEHQEETADEIKPRLMIGPTTPIQLITVVSAVVGAWYLASSLTSALTGINMKLESLTVSVQVMISNHQRQQESIDLIKQRLTSIEVGGSPVAKTLEQKITLMDTKLLEMDKIGSSALLPKIAELQKEVAEIKAKVK